MTPKPSLASRLALGLVLAALGSAALADGYEKRSTARAQQVLSPATAGKVERLDFVQGDFKSWMLQDGNWFVQGRVAHRGLLCGDYQLGARFGVGQRGCDEVEWLGEVQFVARETLCNNNVVTLTGSGSDPLLADKLGRISCVEQVLRCSGTCK